MTFRVSILLLRRPVTKNDCIFQVIYKLCRQVLTPVNNSQLLLKLEILDKLRLVTFHTMATQRKCNVITGSYQFRRNESSHDLDSQSIKVKMLVALGTPFPSMLLMFHRYSVIQYNYHNY